MAGVRSRACVRADLPALIKFATEGVALRLPGLTYWNPGDIAWQLGMFPEHADLSGVARLWEDGAGGVVALAIFEAPLNLEFDILPGADPGRAIEDEVFAWATGLRRELLGKEGDVPAAYAMLAADGLSTSVLDSDEGRAKRLAARGYRKVERHSVRYRRSLEEELPEARPQAGMRFGQASEAKIAERVDLHRGAWSVWGPSSFSESRYRRLRATPIYDEWLDVVVEDGDGRMLSYCVCWFDEANGIGHFEPVGTRPEVAGRGLGRAVVMEGLRRLQERGATTALIGTASVNGPALRTYAACGFELVDRQHYWSKVVG